MTVSNIELFHRGPQKSKGNIHNYGITKCIYKIYNYEGNTFYKLDMKVTHLTIRIETADRDTKKNSVHIEIVWSRQFP